MSTMVVVRIRIQAAAVTAAAFRRCMRVQEKSFPEFVWLCVCGTQDDENTHTESASREGCCCYQRACKLVSLAMLSMSMSMLSSSWSSQCRSIACG